MKKSIEAHKAKPRRPSIRDSSPPHDVELEQEVLSALCFGYREACDQGFRVIEAEDFYVPIHQLMFKGLREAHRQGVVYQSPALFVAWLRDSGTMQRLASEQNEQPCVMSDWAYALRESALPTAVANYADALRTMRARREIHATLRELTDDFERDVTPSLWLKRAAARLQAVRRIVEKATNGKARAG